jgi:hypothetical protein
LALPALAGVACSSSSPPSNSDGGPVTDPCAGAPVTDVNTISDFEDGTGSVLQAGNPPRNGGWYAYNDGTATCMEMPMAHTNGPIPAAMIENGGHCGSKYGFEFSGSGCSFAGIGTDLAAPIPDPDASTDPDAGSTAVALKTPYDLSAFKQIKFWGRLGAGALPAGKSQLVQFKLPMQVDTKVEDGGTCVEMETAKCSASYGQFMTFTSNWKLYTVDLTPGTKTGISQESWGKVFPWDPTNVVSIQFQAANNATFDIWIDDVNLVPK